MAPTAKKRKAAELDGETATKSNGHASPGADSHQESPPLIGLDATEVPFKLICPAGYGKKKKTNGKGDIYGPNTEDGGFPQLETTYTIRPGAKWAELKPYRNFIGIFLNY